MRVPAGTRFGPYEIAQPLGAGGMGEVYDARDTRLDRAVAIKVLPAALATDETARARFDREARAIAALNHPNICALHDIGNADGHGFLVMERLEGETLQDRLQRGALDVEQTIEYGIALADALDAAHARGLIHRDLKPANVFITTRGVVKILDFGLAKSVQESDADVTRGVDDALTVAGTTLGTVAYMSPEQLRAEPFDVRTDLFSLGLVLYEMATGQRAFTGSTSVVVAAGILNQQPQAPRTLRPELPERLEETILKTLEKDLAVRCQSAAELRADLTRVKRGGSSGSVRAMTPHAPAPPSTPAAVQATVRPQRSVVSRLRGLAFALFFTAAFVAAGNWLDWGRSRDGQPPAQGRDFALPSLDAPPQPAPAPPATPQAPPAAEVGLPPPRDALRRTRKPDTTRTPPTTSEPVTTSKPDTATRPDITSRVPSATPPTQDPGPLPSATRGDSARGGRGGRAGTGRGLGPSAPILLMALRKAEPETFDLVYASNDPDARNLALQIRSVLTAGGWTNASTTEIADPQAKIGIFAPRVTPGVTALTNWAIRSGLEPDIRRVPSLTNPRIVIGKQQ